MMKGVYPTEKGKYKVSFDHGKINGKRYGPAKTFGTLKVYLYLSR